MVEEDDLPSYDESEMHENRHRDNAVLCISVLGIIVVIIVLCLL